MKKFILGSLAILCGGMLALTASVAQPQMGRALSDSEASVIRGGGNCPGTSTSTCTGCGGTVVVCGHEKDNNGADTPAGDGNCCTSTYCFFYGAACL